MVLQEAERLALLSAAKLSGNEFHQVMIFVLCHFDLAQRTEFRFRHTVSLPDLAQTVVVTCCMMGIPGTEPKSGRGIRGGADHRATGGQ